MKFLSFLKKCQHLNQTLISRHFSHSLDVGDFSKKQVFKCQADSFLKEFTTKVAKIEKPENGKFHILFEDTILFPEGGGQNTDHGIIVKGNTKLEVKYVFRREREAVHEINSQEEVPLSVGDEVLQVVDWERRFDNMQQHSGQHLISAIFEKEFKYNTKSAGLGDKVSYIELDVKDLKQGEVEKVESMANEYIAQSIPVITSIHEAEDPFIQELSKRAPKEIPKDWSGAVRTIDLVGIGINTCCGTHVSNLSQLNSIKILNVEKKKGRVLVNFLIGSRVLKKLTECFNREQDLIKTLSAPPQDHVTFIKNNQSKLKISQKTINKLTKELALNEVAKLNNLEDKYHVLYRNEGFDSTTFLTVLQKNLELKNKDMFLLVAVSDSFESDKGHLLVQGNLEDFNNLKEAVCEILGGKLNEKNGKVLTKVNHLDKIKECMKLLENYFKK